MKLSSFGNLPGLKRIAAGRSIECAFLEDVDVSQLSDGDWICLDVVTERAARYANVKDFSLPKGSKLLGIVERHEDDFTEETQARVSRWVVAFPGVRDNRGKWHLVALRGAVPVIGTAENLSTFSAEAFADYWSRTLQNYGQLVHGSDWYFSGGAAGAIVGSWASGLFEGDYGTAVLEGILLRGAPVRIEVLSDVYF